MGPTKSENGRENEAYSHHRDHVVTIAITAALLSGAAHAQQVKPSCTDDSRHCMILAATSYLEGLVHHDGSKVLFAPDIVRTEQGRDAGEGEAVLRAKLDKEPAMRTELQQSLDEIVRLAEV
jgi:hypothetical protein